MLTVTEVNRCQICPCAHIALDDKLSAAEFERMVKGALEDVLTEGPGHFFLQCPREPY